MFYCCVQAWYAGGCQTAPVLSGKQRENDFLSGTKYFSVCVDLKTTRTDLSKAAAKRHVVPPIEHES